MEIRKLYINGEWVDSVHDEWIEIENPATHEIIAKVPRGNKEDVDKAVKAARAAFETWQHYPLEERVALIKKVVERLESRTPGTDRDHHKRTWLPVQSFR